MKLTILKSPSTEDWILCKQAAFVTIGKETETEPSIEWKQRILKAVHSPIRTLNYAILISDLPSWVSVHLVRHIHAQPFVSTQRNDRVNGGEEYDRRKAPQDAPVSMIWYFNAEEFMTICHKRLCFLASPETRKVIQEILKRVIDICPEFKGSDLLVPLCTYRGGLCTEYKPCEYYLKHGHGYVAKNLRVHYDLDYILDWLQKEVPNMSHDDFMKILETTKKSRGEVWDGVGVWSEFREEKKE